MEDERNGELCEKNVSEWGWEQPAGVRAYNGADELRREQDDIEDERTGRARRSSPYVALG